MCYGNQGNNVGLTNIQRNMCNSNSRRICLMTWPTDSPLEHYEATITKIMRMEKRYSSQKQPSDSNEPKSTRYISPHTAPNMPFLTHTRIYAHIHAYIYIHIYIHMY